MRSDAQTACRKREDPRKATRGASTDRNFGPKGHDYTRAPDDAKNGRDLAADEIAAIDELLAKRLQAKLQRDFRIADDLQMRLRRMSVEVHDGFKFWRADGGSDFSQRSDQPARGGRSYDLNAHAA